MNFNFDEIVDRRNTNSLKWDAAENELPMWVADMDFQTAPEIKNMIIKRAETGIYGYSVIPNEWYEAIIYWWKKRYDYIFEKEWIHFCTGTIAAITSAVKRITNIGDNVLVQTPVYDNFFHSIENHGRHVIENKLKYNGKEYSINFADLEEKLSNNLTTMMILCNPHNPIGKIWSKAELYKIGELCKKYNVILLSDEVHCDLTEPGLEYIPFVSVSETCKEISITCISPSKTFNIAGLQSAAVVVPNEYIRCSIKRGLNMNEVAEPNVFAVDALISAYTKGEEWLDELRIYLSENKKTVYKFLQEELNKVSCLNSQATYLMWLDCSNVIGNTSELCGFIREKTGLYLSNGINYRGNGEYFMRINIACSRKRLADGLSRLKSGIIDYEKLIERRC